MQTLVHTSDIAFQRINRLLLGYSPTNGHRLTLWSYQLRNHRLGYQIEGITPDMCGSDRLRQLLQELAALAQQSRSTVFVVVENDTVDPDTWEIIGPQSPAWATMQAWLKGIGFAEIEQSEAGTGSLVGVDYGSPAP
jgi:hypothetical protein